MTEHHYVCADGHRHWGVHGAAGLLIRSGNLIYLQRRSRDVANSGTWSVPGGALHPHEEVFVGAFREATEEIGPLPGMDIEALLIDNHGGWAYHTVVVRSPLFWPTGGLHAWEYDDEDWFELDEALALPLHPGMELSLEAL